MYDGYSVPMIYQKIANYEDNDDFTANYKTTILSEITSAAFSDKVEKTAAYAVTEDASAVKTYSPSRFGNPFKPRLSAKPVRRSRRQPAFCAYMFYHPSETGGQNLWHNLASAPPGPRTAAPFWS
ncbi:MAG: hypothetical protein ACLRZH_05680 [Ruthenibacterium lactatiformans]